MINQHDFLTLTGLDWGKAWETQWVHGVDDEFVSFISARHHSLETTRLRCALDLFRSYNSAAARDVAAQFVNTDNSIIRGAARNVFVAHHDAGWITRVPYDDWQPNRELNPLPLTKRQRQRQKKYGQPFARGLDSD